MLQSFDALLLARMQFAFTISFHIIFPAFSIGIASYLAVLEMLWLWKKNSVYLDLFDYWKKIFAVVFGMGVVSGIVMSYQFGTNWSVFSDRAGPVIGPLMGYEVLTAFFLEAGFLGVMLFGLKRVGPSLHMVATAMVALGTLISATWIIAVNSWMQTPAGYAISANGQFIPKDWWAIVFNPSFPYRLVHMVLAAYLATAFFVGAVAAWHLLKDNRHAASRRMFSMALWMAALVTPIQIIAGDLHGINTLEYQPAKVAAMEGHFESHSGAPLILFGIPDDEAEVTRYAISIPRLGSLILTHSLDGEVKGLKAFPKELRPAFCHHLLDLPADGGHRVPDAVLWPVEPVAAASDRWHLQGPYAATRRRCSRTVRFHCDPGRLDHNRSRTTALCDLWRDDNSPGLVAHRCTSDCQFAVGLHHRLLCRFWCRHLLHPAHVRDQTRRRTPIGRTRAGSRHHASRSTRS